MGIAGNATMKVGGWTTRSMFSRNLHPSMDYIREALEQVSKVPLILGEKISIFGRALVKKTSAFIMVDICI